LIVEQLSILLFRQGDQVGNAIYYNDRFTKRVEVAHQAGVCNCVERLGECVCKITVRFTSIILLTKNKPAVVLHRRWQ
jgi:hypothetical protein